MIVRSCKVLVAAESEDISVDRILSRRHTAREEQRAQANREELVEQIARICREDGAVQPLNGLHLYRLSSPLGPIHGVTEPSLCMIAQGSKEILVNDRRYRYDALHYLLATVDLPRVSYVLEASPARPYLSLRLELSPALVSSVMVEAGTPSAAGSAEKSAIDVSRLDGNLLDAVVRLVRLADSPDEAEVLRPLIEREIVYRLLAEDQGGRLSHLVSLGGHAPQIANAVKRIRRDFDQPLRIEHLAGELGMSVSGFHHQFKAVTNMSPLQFQKRLRLQEARRLLLDEELDATSTAHRVGYSDASHFNREYKRLFGEPPVRNIERLKEIVGASGALRMD
jgi:AraC-like DNA-binding protein